MDSNGYWIPIIFSSLTLVFWLCVVAIIYFDTHAFDSSRDSCYRSVHIFTIKFTSPAWYINKFTIIDFTIYTLLFLVKLKSVVDGLILHSKSVVDGSILHCKAKVCVFSKIYDGKFINIPYRNVYQRT
jgi:hypothetical protein